MSGFNPKYLTKINKNGDDGANLTGSKENDFQKYILKEFKEQNYVNRDKRYALAIGPWDKDIHADWFIEKSSSNRAGIKWSEGWMEWMFNRKRPDFVFVKNRRLSDSNDDLGEALSKMSLNGVQSPNKYVIWETKKAWLYCTGDCNYDDEYDNCSDRLQCGIDCDGCCVSYRYCVDSAEGISSPEDKIDDDDSDYEDTDDRSYDIVECVNLNHLHKRAQDQAKEYAELLKSAIPNPNAKIYYRSVVCVFKQRREDTVFEIDFSRSIRY